MCAENKGEKNGTCNVTDCGNSHAIHFNTGMNKYYCTSCARKINDACRQYGDPLLCKWPHPKMLNEDGLLK